LLLDEKASIFFEAGDKGVKIMKNKKTKTSLDFMILFIVMNMTKITK